MQVITRPGAASGVQVEFSSLVVRAEEAIATMVECIQQGHRLVGVASADADGVVCTLLVVEAVRRAAEMGDDEVQHAVLSNYEQRTPARSRLAMDGLLAEVARSCHVNGLPLAVGRQEDAGGEMAPQAEAVVIIGERGMQSSARINNVLCASARAVFSPIAGWRADEIDTFVHMAAHCACPFPLPAPVEAVERAANPQKASAAPVKREIPSIYIHNGSATLH